MLNTASFNSDGCSWVPDFWFRDCCVLHDMGSTDLELSKCIIETAPSEYAVYAFCLAVIYFVGLKMFGWIYQTHKKMKANNDDN
jgi:hypothetical protein